jgi:hypothetical protein
MRVRDAFLYVWIYRVVLFNAMEYMIREKRMLLRYYPEDRKKGDYKRTEGMVGRSSMEPDGSEKLRQLEEYRL